MKDTKFAFRISTKNLEAIKKKAQRAGLTATDYITITALGKEIIIINDILPLLSELKAVGRNLNQLTTLANMGKIRSVYLEDCLQIFGDIYSKLEEISKQVHHGNR